MPQLDGPTREEFSFMTRLAHAMQVPTHGLHLDYPEHLSYEGVSRVRKRVSELAIEAIKNQQLTGLLALEAYKKYRQASLFHGSHLSPQELTPRYTQRPVLRPQQPHWRDGAGRKYKHGDLAICVSDGYQYPLLRSLLNRNHIPGFEGHVLSRRADSTNTAYDFTGLEFLTAIRELDRTGWIYAIDRQPTLEHQVPYPGVTSQDAHEYRLTEDTRPVAWIRTKPEDLPPELIVLDGDVRIADEFVRTLARTTLIDQVQLFEDDLHVYPLGGYFPLTAHPNLQYEQGE